MIHISKAFMVTIKVTFSDNIQINFKIHCVFIFSYEIHSTKVSTVHQVSARILNYKKIRKHFAFTCNTAYSQNCKSLLFNICWCWWQTLPKVFRAGLTMSKTQCVYLQAK